MDIQIEKKTGLQRRHIVYIAVGVLVVAAV